MAEYATERAAILGLAGRRDAAKSADGWETKDIATTYYKVLGLIEKLERGVATEADKRSIAIGKETLGYYKANRDYAVAMANIAGQDYRARIASHTTILKQRLASDSKYNEKVSSADAKLSTEVTRVLNTSVGQADPVVSVFELIKPVELTPGYGKTAKIATDDPRYRETIGDMITQINDKNQKDLFIFVKGKDGRDTREVDIQATENNLRGVKNRKTGAPEWENIKYHLEYYNAANRRHAEHSHRRAEDYQKSEALLAAAMKAGSAGDEDEAKRLLQQHQDHELVRAGTFQLYHNMQPEGELRTDLENRIAEARSRKESHARAIEYADFLSKKMYGEKGDEYGIAKGIANANFRAWAADYGWDALGHVPIDEDGKPDYSRYRPGGDDIAALVAWDKQSLRAPGNYGLKRIDSGEILRVEMKDGSVVTGARLRRHAADPMGSIRVVTAEGARVIQPGEVSQAIYLKRPAPDVTRIDRRAMKIYDRDKGMYDRLTLAAMDRGDDMVRADLVRGEDGQYLKSAETGKYVTQDALEQAKKDRLNTTGHHYIETTDESGNLLQYLAAPDGRVFQVDSKDNLIELKPEEASKILRGSSPGVHTEFGSSEAEEKARSDAEVMPVPLVAQNPMEREYVFVLNENGSMRQFTSEDLDAALKAGKLNTDVLQIPRYVEKEQSEALGAAHAAMTSNEALGMVDEVEPPSDLEGVSLTGGEGSTGIWFTSIDEGQNYKFSDKAIKSAVNQVERAQDEDIDATIGGPERLADRSITIVGATDEMRPDDSPNPLGALPSTAGRELSDEQEMAAYLAQKATEADAAAAAAAKKEEAPVGQDKGPAAVAGKSARERGVWAPVPSDTRVKPKPGATPSRAESRSLERGVEGSTQEATSDAPGPIDRFLDLFADRRTKNKKKRRKDRKHDLAGGVVAEDGGVVSHLSEKELEEELTPGQSKKGEPTTGTDPVSDAMTQNNQIPGVEGVVGDETPKETEDEKATKKKKKKTPTVGQDMGDLGLGPSDWPKETEDEKAAKNKGNEK